MTTRSSTAPAATFLPVSVVVSLIVLIAMLFAVLQTANLPFFPASNTAPYGNTRSPLFRGLVHIPVFRFIPLFRGAPDAAAPDAVDESHMPQSELIDRWEPFIKEASVRFSIPEKWIRTIIRIESGGRTMLWGRPITSGAGAMGVMQLMRDTYNEVSAQNGLGSDPYDVHDNILAGTAYLRELYNRYGYPRLFAAYNAGPAVLEAHMKGRAKLPAETRNYVKLAVAGTATLTPTAPAPSAPAKVEAAPDKLASAVVARHVSHTATAKPVRTAPAHAPMKQVRVARVATHAQVKAVPAAPAHSASKAVRVAVHAAPKTAHAAPVKHSARHVKAA